MMFAISASSITRAQLFGLVLLALAFGGSARADPTISLTKGAQNMVVITINGAGCDELPRYVAEAELRKMSDKFQQLVGCDIGMSINKWRAANAATGLNLKGSGGGGGGILLKQKGYDGIMLAPMTPIQN